MQRKISVLFIILFTLSSVSLFADKKTKEFNLKIIKSNVINNSLYNQMEFIDSRPQHEFMLISIDDSTFTSQLQTTLDYMIDNSAQDNTLLLQLRHLYMKKESDEEMNVYAYMNIYQKKGDRYFLLNTVNRRVKINNPDITDDIITQSITQLISSNLNNESTANISYLDREIEKIDFIEKSRIKIYQTEEFVDGVYANYEEFAAQIPSIKDMEVEMEKDHVKNIKIAKDGGTKMQKIDLKKNYAVVVDHVPYLIFKKEYVPIINEDDELILKIDKTRVSRNFFVVGGGGLLGAFIGGVATAASPANINEENSIYIIDHLDGEVVLKEKKSTNYRRIIFSNKDWNLKEKTEYQ